MTDGIATALAGLISACTVVLLMFGTKYLGPGSGRESRNEQDDDYRRFRDWMRKHPIDEEDEE